MFERPPLPSSLPHQGRGRGREGECGKGQGFSTCLTHDHHVFCTCLPLWFPHVYNVYLVMDDSLHKKSVGTVTHQTEPRSGRQSTLTNGNEPRVAYACLNSTA